MIFKVLQKKTYSKTNPAPVCIFFFLSWDGHPTVKDVVKDAEKRSKFGILFCSPELHGKESAKSVQSVKSTSLNHVDEFFCAKCHARRLDSTGTMLKTP